MSIMSQDRTGNKLELLDSVNILINKQTIQQYVKWTGMFVEIYSLGQPSESMAHACNRIADITLHRIRKCVSFHFAKYSPQWKMFPMKAKSLRSAF
jgi:hypothetical protein